MANTSGFNDELYANFVADAEFAAYEVSVSRSLCKLFPVPMNSGKTVQVPIWGQGTAVLGSTVGEGNPATAQDTTTTSATITLDEHIYYSRVSDMLKDSAFGDVMAQLAEISGRSIGESLDSMAFGKFSSFTSNTVGSTSTELTTELILQAAAKLRAGKVMGPYYAVVHPNAAYNMKKVLTQSQYYSSGPVANAALSNVGNQVLVSGIIGNIGGVTIIESPLVAADGAFAYTCGVFAPTALGIAERGGLQLSTLYLPQNRATDLNVVAVAGAGVLQQSHGVKLTVQGVID